MATGSIEVDVYYCGNFPAVLDEIRALLLERPDKAGEFEALLFHEGKLRPGVLSVVQSPTSGAGNLSLCFDFSDEYLKHVRALIAGDVDCGVFVDDLVHGFSPSL